MANINISIPDDVHKNLKVAAVMQQQALKSLIIETLEQYLSDSSPVSRSQKTNKLQGGARK